MELTADADRLLGRKTIEGDEVEGYEIDGLKLGLTFGGSLEDQDSFVPSDTAPEAERSVGRLWVDVETLLPVRMEYSIVGVAMVNHVRAVFDQFEWDVPLEAEFFEPVYDESFTEIELTIPPLSEETLIAGLQLYADTVGDTYPAMLEPALVVGRMAGGLAAGGAFQEKADNAPSRELMQMALTAGQACAFYQLLEREGREPEYFGDVVKVGDAEAVLLRWRLSDSSVRVIYGDLTATTERAR
jgi:hypothetical protein